MRQTLKQKYPSSSKVLFLIFFISQFYLAAILLISAIRLFAWLHISGSEMYESITIAIGYVFVVSEICMCITRWVDKRFWIGLLETENKLTRGQNEMDI